LENRTEQVLPGSKGVEGKGRKQRAGGREGPNNFAHMNKRINNKKLSGFVFEFYNYNC
jgi:hypothetical protein